jgi:hypothetical protein
MPPIDYGPCPRWSGIPVSANLHIEYATSARCARDPHKCLPYDALFARSVPFDNVIAVPAGSRCLVTCGEIVSKPYANLHGCLACSFKCVGGGAGWLDARRAPCFDPLRRGGLNESSGNGGRMPLLRPRPAICLQRGRPPCGSSIRREVSS